MARRRSPTGWTAQTGDEASRAERWSCSWSWSLTRPLHARAASDNVASLRVLQKAGFTIVGTENSYATGRNSQIEETLLRKD